MSDADTRQAVSDAITQAIHGDGDMVTKWVACIEGFNSDGERYLWLMSDEDSMPWDRLGMLTFALGREQADITAANDED
jgi:hypothetical protein